MVAEGYKNTEIGVIPVEWDVVELSTITTILLSNVDKKSKNDEQDVKLCNYMDVYNNQYITNDLVYMEATAKDNQIEKFQLQINDVIITKDSETKDDIAIPAVVMETFENLICGYHLAVLRPKKDILYGVYLMNAIGSTTVHKHFEKLANGITRFGLTSSSINQALIPLPPLKEQEKIANILSTADDKISAIASQIEKAQTLKKGLLQKLLSEGIGHSEFKDSKLGKIPVGWEIKSLLEIGSFSKGKGISKNEVIEDGIPCMRYAEIYTEYDTILKNIKSFINEKSAQNSKKILNGDILFAGSGETLDDIGKSVAFIDDFEAYVGGDTIILSQSIDYNSLFMAYQLNSTLVRFQLRKLGQGSSVVHIYSSGLEKVRVSFPPLKEQKQIAQILSTADEKIELLRAKKEKYETLKKGLLQKLLSGEIRLHN